MPIWQALLGFADYVIKKKGDTTYLQTFYLIIQCKAIEPGGSPNKKYIVLDENFCKGNAPYGSDISSYMKTHWYPCYTFQQETINAFVECSPFMPKMANQKLSTWELKSKYTFYFKWGGAELPEPEVKNPKDQAAYDVPDKLSQAIQIADPSKQSATKALHLWDFRRGFITAKALKRIYQDTESDESLYSDTEETPKKKRNTPRKHTPRKHTPMHTPRNRRDPEMSPLSLRRKYMPRTERRQPPAPHPAAAAAAKAAQATAPQANSTSTDQTSSYTITHRNIRLTLFKPGFEQETEEQLDTSI